MLFVKNDKYISFCLYHRSYLLCPPVIWILVYEGNYLVVPVASCVPGSSYQRYILWGRGWPKSLLNNWKHPTGYCACKPAAIEQELFLKKTLKFYMCVPCFRASIGVLIKISRSGGNRFFSLMAGNRANMISRVLIMGAWKFRVAARFGVFPGLQCSCDHHTTTDECMYSYYTVIVWVWTGVRT